jgi:hypothetical protein
MQHEFSPLADASPYSDLLSSKYRRAIAATGRASGPIPATDLSIAILDELVPEEALTKMQIGDAIKYRKESQSAREAFLEHLLTLYAKVGEVPPDGNYSAAIEKILATEVRPVVTEFRNQLLTIHEKLFGKILAGALAVAGSSGVVQLFGDMTWQKLLSLAGAAGAYIATQAIEAVGEERAARRDYAISYLLDLEAKK